MKPKPTSAMKLKLTTCSALMTAASFLAAQSEVQAALLFEDNFDGSEYDQGFVVAPPTGAIAHGIWYVNNLNNGVYSGSPGDRTQVSEVAALSPDRSLALNVASLTDQAQVIGILSADGGTASPTSDAINVRFAFNRSSAGENPTVFVVRNTADQNMGVINIGVAGQIEVAYTAATQVLSPILSDTWYYLNVEMPANPGVSIEFKVSLFDADGVTLINSVTGSFAGTEGASYSYFSIYNNGQETPFTTYIDNITVQSVPEPGTVGLAVVGAVGGVFLAARRKK